LEKIRADPGLEINSVACAAALPSTSMLETISKDLNQPEYVHVMLNSLPVYGLIVGIIGLVLALLLRSRSARITALAVVFVSAASAWPTAHYGEQAYDRVLSMADDAGQAWLDAHARRADNLVWCFYVLALVAAAAIATPKTWPRLGASLTVLSLCLAMVSLGAGGYIAYAGGKIRHREFRTVPPPERAPSDESR
jgi:disulfide bond formation protein DsbB